MDLQVEDAGKGAEERLEVAVLLGLVQNNVDVGEYLRFVPNPRNLSA